jgi:hypothetical protein
MKKLLGVKNRVTIENIKRSQRQKEELYVSAAIDFTLSYFFIYKLCILNKKMYYDKQSTQSIKRI